MSIDGWNFDEYSPDGFLRVKPFCQHKVRFLSKPVKVIKIFRKDTQNAVLENEEDGRLLKSIYRHKLGWLSIRYICWCINRDDGKLVVLDMPVSVAQSISRQYALTKKPISGINDGCDWQILSNGKQGKEARYNTVYLHESPLSEAEKQMIKDKVQSNPGIFDLSKMYTPLSFEQAEQKLFR